MRSADTKTRKTPVVPLSFTKDIRAAFHKKIYDYVCDVFYGIMDEEIHLMEDVNKKMVFHLFINDEKVVITIFLDFLKIVGIEYEDFPNKLYKQFIQTIMTLKGKTSKTL